MLARHELSRDGFVLVGVGKGSGVGVEGRVGGLALDEVGPPVTAGKAFADDLRGEAEICAAFAAAKVGGVPGEEPFLRRSDWARIEVG